MCTTQNYIWASCGPVVRVITGAGSSVSCEYRDTRNYRLQGACEHSSINLDWCPFARDGHMAPKISQSWSLERTGVGVFRHDVSRFHSYLHSTLQIPIPTRTRLGIAGISSSTRQRFKSTLPASLETTDCKPFAPLIQRMCRSRSGERHCRWSKVGLRVRCKF